MPTGPFGHDGLPWADLRVLVRVWILPGNTRFDGRRTPTATTWREEPVVSLGCRHGERHARNGENAREWRPTDIGEEGPCEKCADEEGGALPMMRWRGGGEEPEAEPERTA